MEQSRDSGWVKSKQSQLSSYKEFNSFFHSSDSETDLRKPIRSYTSISFIYPILDVPRNMFATLQQAKEHRLPEAKENNYGTKIATKVP